MADSKIKICVVTGTRAEYGLLYWFMKAVQEDPDLELQLVVTGMHLSPEFGLTYREIEKDGFHIHKKIDILLSSDQPSGINKAMGLAMISMGEAFMELNPDLVFVHGDRFEIFAAAAAAVVCRMPIAHVSGGETTLGAMDEAFRHSITKMAALHFVSTEIYRQRVIQLGENPEHVFNIGATGVDNIKRMTLVDRKGFEESINFKLAKLNLLVTFHPVTLEHVSAATQFAELLKALDRFPEAHIIFTMPNADTDSRILFDMIDDYVKRNEGRAAAYTSLGQLRYLSAVKNTDMIVGNSSSGIVEGPLFRKPTINIGDRQKGRIMGETILNCEPTEEEIYKAIQHALTPAFQQVLLTAENPYGEGNTPEKVIAAIKKSDLKNLIKKPFFDLDCK